MLPVARSADGQLRGGAREYLKRRAWRILPPYYIALVASLLLIAIIPWLQHETGINTLTSLPAFTPGVILSHLFLVHNLHGAWVYRINSPLWTVATEWQIYFLFPALLLPAWRRFGVPGAVLVGFILGLGIHFVFHGHYDLAAPWFIGLFALGMAGAAINFSKGPLETLLRNRVPWGTLALVLTGLLILLASRLTNKYLPHLEILTGICATCFLIYCARRQAESSAENALPLRLLNSRWAVTLGGFSYSLYLTHYVILNIVHGLANQIPSPTVECLVMLTVGVLTSVAVAYLFYLCFERRFTPGYKSAETTRQNARATSESPGV